MLRETQATKTLPEIIRAEISQNGALPFVRFMQLALYCPIHGYYETQKDTVGRRGDFYTNASTGGLFGQLLAFQFSEWLETNAESRKPGVGIVEAGAHDGKLAGDILRWLQANRPELFAQIEYGILEPSPRRREWQKETLKHFKNVRWHSRGSDPALQQFNGIIFSNELLDAFPVRRFGWDAKNKKWFEWGVAADGGKFAWTKLENSEFRIPNFELEAVLPGNYTIETSPAAEDWWREAAGILQRGKLLTIDYGLTADELFSPQRTGGTLRAYFRHHFADDVLANPGEQDLTAHVNFPEIQKIGEAAGLKTDFFSTQTKFLAQILEKFSKQKSFEWNPAHARQFQTLTHPEHLGRAFRVLVQSR